MASQRYGIVIYWAGPGWYGERYVTSWAGERVGWHYLHGDLGNKPDRLDDERYAGNLNIEWLDEVPDWADFILVSEILRIAKGTKWATEEEGKDD